MLKFIDDTQISLFGLDETFADLYNEGWLADDKTVEEIIKRLEAMNNYIPSSERAHRDYAYTLLKEYREYVKDQAGKKQK
jgi:hypothetical protein